MVRPISPDAQHVAHIVTVIAQATEEDRMAGKLWYNTYRESIVQLARKHGLTPEQGLALFAVLSQQTSIHRNWQNYVICATTRDPERTIATLPLMRAKCRAILADTVHPGQYVSGPKITAFFLCLCGSEDTVCVDRHAISACFNRMLNEVGSKYNYVAECYRVAAAMVGLTPAQTQAVCWLAWRRMKGIVDQEVTA